MREALVGRVNLKRPRFETSFHRRVVLSDAGSERSHQTRLCIRQPTRPTKKNGNPHAKKFADDQSVELDAMDPADLQDLLQTAIAQYADRDQIDIIRIAEESERRTISRLARSASL